jgi:Tfp pilus assembly protein PilF
MLAGTVLLLALAAQAPANAPAAVAPPLAPPAYVGPAATNVAAGLEAFRHRRFAAARAEFEKAVAADPQSAAATFYLAYAHYKLGEPSRRMNPDKQQAKELFAKAFSLDPTFKPVWH